MHDRFSRWSERTDVIVNATIALKEFVMETLRLAEDDSVAVANIAMYTMAALATAYYKCGLDCLKRAASTIFLDSLSRVRVHKKVAERVGRLKEIIGYVLSELHNIHEAEAIEYVTELISRIITACSQLGVKKFCEYYVKEPFRTAMMGAIL